jgi:hypothetical protein
LDTSDKIRIGIDKSVKNKEGKFSPIFLLEKEHVLRKILGSYKPFFSKAVSLIYLSKRKLFIYPKTLFKIGLFDKPLVETSAFCGRTSLIFG